jgi:predicted ABC-type ATPase
MNSDLLIEEAAYDFIKRNSELLIDTFCGNSRPVLTPVSLFMAGSPGAGKTEVSLGFMRRFETIPVRIDADEIRKMCPGYTGINAHLFQKAASKGVNILYDYALENKLHLILDGTFAYTDAIKNIRRSLARNRIVELWYVYQDPIKAWEFTRAREAFESRHVTKETFVRAFFRSRINAAEAKTIFGPSLILNLLIKNIDNSDGQLQFNIKVNELDVYLGKTYTEENLSDLLS